MPNGMTGVETTFWIKQNYGADSNENYLIAFLNLEPLTHDLLFIFFQKINES
jgi:hypothetical protein